MCIIYIEKIVSLGFCWNIDLNLENFCLFVRYFWVMGWDVDLGVEIRILIRGMLNFKWVRLVWKFSV